ncbi:hypothetical protein ATANTOWER_026957, partial [Ataeniobius toweri]|nr:hypothetical protein [Ataeniobius toweri]
MANRKQRCEKTPSLPLKLLLRLFKTVYDPWHHVDPPIPSCQEGLYLPQFVAPTPSDGERIVAEVQKELAIRIKAQARYSLIDNLIFSGPTNITKHRLTHNEFEIRWTPVEDDLGDYYPICFAVESVK